MKKTLLLLFCFPMIGFGQTQIPDINFEQALINLGYDTGTPDGSVPTTNINSVTNLDVNSKDVNGDGNFLINGSGSFTQMNIGATTNTFDAFFNLSPSSINQNIFLIQSGSFQSVKVNSTGVVNLGGFESEPTYVSGGFYYNSDENEFYLGV